VGELKGGRAVISGKIDYLRGLNENVIMGRLIPAGTKGVLPPGEDPRGVIEHPELEQLDSEYSPKYLIEPDFIKDQTECRAEVAGRYSSSVRRTSPGARGWPGFRVWRVPHTACLPRVGVVAYM
jgi:hypothetical protein